MKQIRVLRRGGFGLLAASALLSRFGDILAALGFIYLAYRMTESHAATTAVAVAEVVPYLLFGLLGGVISDLLPKLRVMQAANWYRAVLELAVVALLLTNTMSYVILLVLPLLIQLGGIVYNPCSRAVIASLVEPKDRVAANSVMSLIDNVTAVLAPLAASAVLLLGDAIWMFFLVDAVTFIIGGFLLRALEKVTKEAALPPGADLQSLQTMTLPPTVNGRAEIIARACSTFRRFWSGVGRSPVLIQIFTVTFLAVLCGTWAWRMGVLFISVPNPHESTWFYASMLALYAISSMLTGIALPAITDSLRLGHYRLAVVGWAAALLLIGLSGSPIAVAAGVALLGASVSLASQTRSFLLQEHVDQTVMGQGFATAAVLLYAADALSLVIFGAISEAFSAGHTVALAGALMLVGLGVSRLAFRLLAR